jgi:hypothetical protein
MKKFVILPIVVALAGCETFVTKKETPVPQVTERVVEKVIYKHPSNVTIDSSPEWMHKLPKTPGILYSSASARSQDYSMAVEKARTLAQSKIAETLDSKIDKQTKMFQADKNGSYVGSYQSATRKKVENVSLTGVELVDTKVVLESTNVYRAFVLMAIKLDEQKVEVKEPVKEVDAETEAFNELDKKPVKTPEIKPKEVSKNEKENSNGIIVTPVASLDRSRMITNSITDEKVKARVAEVLKDPNAVVMNTTIR